MVHEGGRGREVVGGDGLESRDLSSSLTSVSSLTLRLMGEEVGRLEGEEVCRRLGEVEVRLRGEDAERLRGEVVSGLAGRTRI